MNSRTLLGLGLSLTIGLPGLSVVISGTVSRSCAQPLAGAIVYTVRAGGPVSYVGLTNSPESNQARLFLIDWDRLDPLTAVLRLSNGEPRSILVWNVRVQARTTGRGTDGFGWETLVDEYPSGDLKAWYKPGEVGKFRANMVGSPPWRVCLIYSKEPAEKVEGSRVAAVGNFEILTEEIKPAR